MNEQPPIADQDAGEYPDVLGDDVPVPVAWWWTEEGRAQRIAEAQAEAWGKAVEAVAWTLANGPDWGPSQVVSDALVYVGKNNPYRVTSPDGGRA